MVEIKEQEKESNRGLSYRESDNSRNTAKERDKKDH